MTDDHSTQHRRLRSRPQPPRGRLAGYHPYGYREAGVSSGRHGAGPGSLVRRVGRFPAVVAGMVLGAGVSWGVNAYAPAAVEKAVGTPVVQVSAGYDSDRLSDGWWAALPDPANASDVPKAVNSCDSFRRWAVNRNAADVTNSWLLLSFRGTRLRPVSVTGIRVVVDAKSDVYDGAELSCESAGAGAAVPVAVNLDEPDPVLRFENEDGSLGAPWFSTNALTLGEDEVVTFAVHAMAFKAAYSWHLEAVVRSDSGQTVVRIPGSYRTTGATGSYHDQLSWRWDLQPQRLQHTPGTA